MGGTVGTAGTSKSNAYVEPEPHEDPNFISLDQASKHVHAYNTLLRLTFSMGAFISYECAFEWVEGVTHTQLHA